ncbi:MAG: hypothetical protein AAF432_15050, partial [Planctomycetota bacterium]
KQVEYYFSDSNLPRDKFLRAKTEEDPQGFVPISVLLTFNRLKALDATEKSIADALRSSSLLSLNEQATSVRRISPLPEKSLFKTRAVFAKGWTAGGPEPSIEDINKLFSPSGSVLSVQIRRWKGDDGNLHFKGSIFVEMDFSEAAERVVRSIPLTWKWTEKCRIRQDECCRRRDMIHNDQARLRPNRRLQDVQHLFGSIERHGQVNLSVRRLLFARQM